jgi:CRP/FNR family transcriptional regulator, anaerobic regulatory protein
MSSNVIELLISKGDRRTFPKGTTLLNVNDAVDDVVFVLSGEVRVFSHSAEGKQISLYWIGASETCILGTSCLFSKKPYPASAETASVTELLVLKGKDFLSFYDEYQEIRQFVFEMLSQRLGGVMALVSEVAFQKMDQRLANFLYEKSEGDLVIPMTHDEISLHLGTSREVISRIIKHLATQDLLILERGQVKIVNRAGLKSLFV